MKRSLFIIALMFFQAAFAENLLTNTKQLQSAQNSLRNMPEFKGVKLYIYEQINFFDGVSPRIELAIASPKLPEITAFYTYQNGKWSEPKIERIINISNWASHLIPLDNVIFTDVAPLAQKWRQKAQSVNAVITEPYYLSYTLSNNQHIPFWHTAIIESTGKQYYLSFHANGKIWEFKDISQESSPRE